MTSSQSPADDDVGIIDPEVVVADDDDDDGLKKEPNVDETENEKLDDSSAAASETSDDDFNLREFRLSVVSDILFLLASVFYVGLGVNDYLYAKEFDSLPDTTANELSSGVADDKIWAQSGFTDDYVFQTGKGAWVSRYQMFYFAAAFCFVLTGMIDFILSPGLLAVVLMLAGACGVASACLTEYHEDASNIMNIISVHLFLVEAAGLFFSHDSSFGKKNWKLTWLVRIGNLLWIVRSRFTIILSLTL